MILGGSLDEVLTTAGCCVDAGRRKALVGDLDRIVSAVAERTKQSKSEDDCQNLELAICTWTRIPCRRKGSNFGKITMETSTIVKGLGVLQAFLRMRDVSFQ